MHFEQDYKTIIMRCLLDGSVKRNRNGFTKYLFAETLKIDLNKGFPIVTGKKIFFEKALGEFLWIWGGHTDIGFLHKYNIKWWDEYAKNGNVNKSYGHQVKSFGKGTDQIEYAANELSNSSRRAVVTLWNPEELKEQVLPCCYTQLIYSRDNDKLNLQVTFRSSDLFLGLPYDVCVLSLFLISMAKKTGLKPDKLSLTLTDAHIYEEHKEQAIKYYHTPNYTLPKLDGKKLKDYKHGKLIKAKLIL